MNTDHLNGNCSALIAAMRKIHATARQAIKGLMHGRISQLGGALVDVEAEAQAALEAVGVEIDDAASVGSKSV